MIDIRSYGVSQLGVTALGSLKPNANADNVAGARAVAATTTAVS